VSVTAYVPREKKSDHTPPFDVNKEQGFMLPVSLYDRIHKNRRQFLFSASASSICFRREAAEYKRKMKVKSSKSITVTGRGGP
jgi:hypothetical protein